jgi:hypothetical protein
MSSFTGYESSQRLHSLPFSGQRDDWLRWKRKFLVYMDELGLDKVVDGHDTDPKNQAKVFRLLFLCCQGTAEELLHTLVDSNKGYDAWITLLKHYEQPGPLQVAALHQKLFSFQPPREPGDVASFINNVLHTQSQLKELRSPVTDEMVSGLIKRSLPTELAMYTDVLDITKTDVGEKLELLQTKATQLVAQPTHDTHAFQTNTGPRFNASQGHSQDRGTGHSRGNGRGRGNHRRSYTHGGRSNDSQSHVPRKVFKCPYHKSNGHAEEDCHAIKAIMKKSESAKQSNTEEDIAWSAHGTECLLDFGHNSENPDTTQLQNILSARQVNTQAVQGFCIDSACSHHMVPEQQDFSSYNKIQKIVRLADGSTTTIAGQGTIVISWKDKFNERQTTDIHAYHVPTFTTRLFSVSQAISEGTTFSFGQQNQMTLNDGRTLPIMKVGTELKVFAEPIQHAQAAAVDETGLWHDRMGHIGFEKLQLLVAFPAQRQRSSFANHVLRPRSKGQISQKTRSQSRKNQANAFSQIALVRFNMG